MMSSQKTEDHWQARASEAGSRERLKQANRRMDATEARADLAGRCLVRCPWRENHVVKRCRPWTGKMANGMIDDTDDDKTEVVNSLLATPHLADALESDRFRHFLDQIPIAIVISEILSTERIIYANPEFEKLSGQPASELLEKPWSHLQGKSDPTNEAQHDLGTAIVYSSGHVGTFVVKRPEGDKAVVDVYSNVIEDECGRPAFPLAALVDVGVHDQAHHVARHARLGPSVLISENWY